MYIKNSFTALLTTLLILAFAVSVTPVFSGDSDTATTPSPTQEPKIDPAKVEEIQNQIEELTSKLKDTRNKKASLSNQISYMNNQIQLTTLKLRETSVKVDTLTEDIDNLSSRIVLLENSLTDVSKLLIDRIVATYKTGHTSPVSMIFASEGFADLVSRVKYLELVQSHDKRLLFEVQATKSDFEEQKSLLETKKEELAALQSRLQAQSNQLDQQKKDKEYLLEVTKNDEKKYQQLIQTAQSELEAIQAIVAGKGSETKAGHVNEGDKIASIISGASCNSTGAHTHFMVTENGVVKNPFNYLREIEYNNCSGSSCGSGDGDPFNPSGDWSWPLNPSIKFSQGYGVTWAVGHIPWLPYNFHDGIDINSTSGSTVKAVKSGTLYQGSYTGMSGCRLRYVRVDHDDSDFETLYLHINY